MKSIFASLCAVSILTSGGGNSLLPEHSRDGVLVGTTPIIYAPTAAVPRLLDDNFCGQTVVRASQATKPPASPLLLPTVYDPKRDPKHSLASMLFLLSFKAHINAIVRGCGSRTFEATLGGQLSSTKDLHTYGAAFGVLLSPTDDPRAFEATLESTIKTEMTSIFVPLFAILALASGGNRLLSHRQSVLLAAQATDSAGPGWLALDDEFCGQSIVKVSQTNKPLQKSPPPQLLAEAHDQKHVIGYCIINSTTHIRVPHIRMCDIRCFALCTMISSVM